nr:DNA-directed RNA polymerase IV subunit 1 isoform X1 [Tanacetum cinerariifolium]
MRFQFFLSEGDAEKASVKEITVPNEVTDPISQCHTCGAKDYRTCEGHIGLIKFSFTVYQILKDVDPNSLCCWVGLPGGVLWSLWLSTVPCDVACTIAVVALHSSCLTRSCLTLIDIPNSILSLPISCSTSNPGIYSLTSIGSPLYILNHHSAFLYCGLVPCIRRCSKLIVGLREKGSYDWVSNASVLVRFSIRPSAGELELARGGGSCVKDDVDEDGEPCCVLETFDNNTRGSAVG